MIANKNFNSILCKWEINSIKLNQKLIEIKAIGWKDNYINKINSELILLFIFHIQLINFTNIKLISTLIYQWILFFLSLRVHLVVQLTKLKKRINISDFSIVISPKCSLIKFKHWKSRYKICWNVLSCNIWFNNKDDIHIILLINL
jgi:hypothetical protein